MADTGGIGALLKALNESPALGSGLKPGGVGRLSGVARAAAPTASSSIAAAKTNIARSFRAAAAAPTQLPRVLGAEGKGFDPKAPKGSYVNLLV